MIFIHLHIYQEASYVTFDMSVPRGTSFGLYARRKALPTHTHYNFMEVITGLRDQSPRSTRSIEVGMTNFMFIILKAMVVLLQLLILLVMCSILLFCFAKKNTTKGPRPFSRAQRMLSGGSYHVFTNIQETKLVYEQLLFY